MRPAQKSLLAHASRPNQSAKGNPQATAVRPDWPSLPTPRPPRTYSVQRIRRKPVSSTGETRQGRTSRRAVTTARPAHRAYAQRQWPCVPRWKHIRRALLCIVPSSCLLPAHRSSDMLRRCHHCRRRRHRRHRHHPRRRHRRPLHLHRRLRRRRHPRRRRLHLHRRRRA